MQVKISKRELLTMISIASKAVSLKPGIEILTGLKLSAIEDGSVIMRGEGEDMGITYRSKAAVSESGDIAVDARLFGETVKRLSGTDIVIKSDNNSVTLECSQSKFKLSLLPVKEFPDRDAADPKHVLELKQSTLKKIIQKTVSFAAASEGKKPILTGILLNIKDNKLTVVASDGLRMARIVADENVGCEDASIVIPVTAMKEILKITGDSDDSVKICSDDKKITFAYGEIYTLTTRTLDGAYLDYERIMTDSGSVKVTVKKSDMTDLLERVKIIVDSENSGKNYNKLPVKLEIGSDDVIKGVCSARKGAICDEISAETTGGHMTIGFNCDYLLDALKGCEQDKITMSLTDPVHGVFIYDIEGVTYLVLPVRLYK